MHDKSFMVAIKQNSLENKCVNKKPQYLNKTIKIVISWTYMTYSYSIHEDIKSLSTGYNPQN